MHNFTFEAIGTSWSIETPDAIGPGVKEKIERGIEAFDKVYSRFRDDSLVRQIATEGPGVYVFPDSIKQIYKFYQHLYAATKGKVTPLIGGSLESLGYDKEYSLKPYEFTTAPDWESVMELDGNNLKLRKKVTIEIGAAGKGYLVDQLSDLLKKAGLESFVIDASGDIYAFNTSQRVGLENPFDTTKVLGVASINNQALCASSVNRRRWGDGLHHVIDPTSGKPVDDIIATWVVAGTTMQADGIATALFFADPEDLRNIAQFDYAVLRKDGTMLYSKESNWEIFA